jgi:AcrR family transcriptional regulator
VQERHLADSTGATAPPVDRRVQRTRNALVLALLALMAERGWDEIDVMTLCERANVGRSTFYQHFSNKEELLKTGFAGLKSGLLAHAANAPAESGPLGFVPALVAHMHDTREVFRALLVRRSGHYVQDRFRELLIELILSGEPPARASQWQVVARAHYLAGALFEMLVWWLGSNRPHHAREIEALFSRWSRAVLEAPVAAV